MALSKEVKIKQTTSGWGGFKGPTNIVVLVKYLEIDGDGRKEEYVPETRSLGMILNSGKFTPVNLLTKIEDLKNEGVTVSEATMGMLALAKVPTQHLKPEID